MLKAILEDEEKEVREMHPDVFIAFKYFDLLYFYGDDVERLLYILRLDDILEMDAEEKYIVIEFNNLHKIGKILNLRNLDIYILMIYQFFVHSYIRYICRIYHLKNLIIYYLHLCMFQS